MRQLSVIGVLVVWPVVFCLRPAMAQDQATPQSAASGLIEGYYKGMVRDSTSFRQLVANAVFDHPDVAAALAEQRGAVADIKAARARRRPKVDVNVSGDYRFADDFEDLFDNLTERSRPDKRVNASLVGRQLIFDAGASRNRIDAAEADEEARRLAYVATSGDVALRASQSYLNVLRTQTLIHLADDFVVQHESYFERVELRAERGAGVRRNVARARARLMDARARRLSFVRDLNMAEAAYEEIFGSRPAALAHPGNLPGLPTSRDDARERAHTSNPLMALSEAEAQSARRRWRAEKASGLPQLRAELAATKFDIDKSRSDYSVTGRLLFDYGLYTGGARSASQAKAFEVYQRQQSLAGSREREVLLAADNAWSRWQIFTEQRDLLAAAVDANGESREAFLEQFTASRGSLLDLLQAEEDFFEASVAFANALADTDFASLVLLMETGNLLNVLNIQAVPERLGVR